MISTLERRLIFLKKEIKGLAVFRANCASCHSELLFTDFSFRNNGLPVNAVLNDSGRFEITRSPEDDFKYKIPSLRNLDYSGLFMHDGSIRTISRVLEHYDNGIEPNLI